MSFMFRSVSLALSIPALLIVGARDAAPVIMSSGVQDPPEGTGAVHTAALPMATGCAPGARCIAVTGTGRPQANGAYIAQCRGKFADFIVPRATLPAGYAGPWFQPSLLERASTGVPAGSRPWKAFDPRKEAQRLGYVLALRNYAFSSDVVRALTPALTADGDYLDPAGGSVTTAQRGQRWYPAPRMFYGRTDAPGTREAAYGMTLERTVRVGELGGNTSAFQNYAVAYYDARGGRVFQRMWKTGVAGIDTAKLSGMKFSEGSFVFKLLFSAARPDAFPQDLLAGSLGVQIRPNMDAGATQVRLMQIDIAVKDKRAGATGWYFATYAYDASTGSSPWTRMAPVGLMWGNDPDGTPLRQTWINPAAPAYARAHLGVDGRLNGAVDNPASACMSCHSTAQAPSLAGMLPTGACNTPGTRAAWFRNLSGGTAFGRRQPAGGACATDAQGIKLTAADYSLQMAATVARSLPGAAGGQTYNPCTWNENAPPGVLSINARRSRLDASDIEESPITRDPPESP